MSQRGGDVQSNLRISSSPISSDLIPMGGADLVVSLEPMEALRYVQWLKPQGWIVTNTVPFVNIGNYPEAGTLDKELHAWPNTVAFDMDVFAVKGEKIVESNIAAFRAGLEYTKALLESRK